MFFVSQRGSDNNASSAFEYNKYFVQENVGLVKKPKRFHACYQHQKCWERQYTPFTCGMMFLCSQQLQSSSNMSSSPVSVFLWLPKLSRVCGVRGSNVTEKQKQQQAKNRRRVEKCSPSWGSTTCCLLVLSMLVHPAATTGGHNLSAHPVSKSGWPGPLFTILLVFYFFSCRLSDGPCRNKLRSRTF